MNIEEISKLWENHEGTTFPEGFHNKKVGETNLTVLESDTAANIMTFIYTNGRLVGRRKAELQNQVETLLEAIEDLSGEAKTYFEKLKKIGENVLEVASE